MKEFLDISSDVNFQDDKVVIKGPNGQEVSCDILFTFECEDNGRSYIGFTDNSFDSEDKLNIYVCYSDTLLDDGSLRNVETEEEIEMVNEVVNEILNNIDEGGN